MRRIERLTAQDLITLWPDEAGWPQDIGVVALLEGGDLLDPDGRFRLEAVRTVVDARLPLVPRLRQVVHAPRRGLGRPLWVDAAAFDLRDHVQAVAPPDAGDETPLLAVVEQLRRHPLDRSGPLWEMWFSPGLAGGRIGVYLRAHHVIADGVAGLAILAALLDPVPPVNAAPAPPWTPTPAPPARVLVEDNLRHHLAAAIRALGTCARPVTAARRARIAWTAVRGMLADGLAPRSSLNRPIGAAREFAVVQSRLGVVREIAHLHDAKVNDVVLTAVAGGLRDLLRGRGEPVEDLVLRAFVPVSLHQSVEGGPRGNLLGQMIVPLPLGVADPVRRLGLIAAASAARKPGVRPRAGAVVDGQLVRYLALRSLSRQRMGNTYVANVPGPPHPVYLAGAAVRTMIPVVALMGNIALGVGALSYAGQLTITVVGDAAVCPDVDVVARGMETTLESLQAARRDYWD